MGFASYLEDINVRLGRIEEIIKDHNTASDKKIDINDYFELRKEVLKVMGKVRPYIERDIDIVENGELRKTITDFQVEIENLKKHNEQLTKSNKQLDIDLHEKNERLARTIEDLTMSRKQMREEADLRQSHKQVQHDYSELLLEFSSLFQHMKDITKSNDWFKNKENLKQLEILINNGLRKT
jgi:FtsZ-binding cell division protein ZapB